tara:strand:- start:297 stop:449 length:153 start_codon:yes stop_codon:yes gene_type:complete
MIITILGREYDLSKVEEFNRLSDVIADSGVNASRQITQTLLTAVVTKPAQ